MQRLPIRGLQAIEGERTDPGLVSSTIVKLIFASREFVVKIYDSNASSGDYVVVLEGTVDVGQWERIAEEQGYRSTLELKSKVPAQRSPDPGPTREPETKGLGGSPAFQY